MIDFGYMRYPKGYVSQFDIKKYRIERRAKRKALGLCTKCDRPAVKGKTDCQECIEDGLRRSKKRIEKGVCISCFKEAREGVVRCENCSLKMSVLGKKRQRERKTKVLTHYGKNGNLECCWEGCEVTDLDMLTLDHVENNGADHRKQYTKTGRGGGAVLYDALIRQGFPKGFQTLCANHNLKKHILSL